MPSFIRTRPEPASPPHKARQTRITSKVRYDGALSIYGNTNGAMDYPFSVSQTSDVEMKSRLFRRVQRSELASPLTIVPIAAALSMILGYEGLSQFVEGRPEFGHRTIDLFFYALQLFVLASEPLQVGGPYPLALDIARFLAPAISLFAVLEAARVIRLLYRSTQSLNEDVELERERLQKTIDAHSRTSDPPSGAGEGARPDGTNSPSPKLDAGGVGAVEEAEEREIAKFTDLLVDYYAHALAYARASARVSSAFSVLGGSVLLVGVVLSVWQSRDGQSTVGSGISSVAGAITSSVGLLFQKDARQALTHLQGQTTALRQDSAARRQMARALHLLGSVEDPVLQDQLRAGLIVKLASSQLGEFPLPLASHQQNGETTTRAEAGQAVTASP